MASAAEVAAREAVLDVLDSGKIVTVEELAAVFFPPNPGFSSKESPPAWFRISSDWPVSTQEVALVSVLRVGWGND